MGVTALIGEQAVQAGHVVMTKSGFVVRVPGMADICKIKDIQMVRSMYHNLEEHQRRTSYVLTDSEL